MTADERGDRQWAVGVMAATLAAVLLAWQFVDAAFNDDWSYAATVRDLLDTGHLRYNGWASASLVAQAYWGAAWAGLFGFGTVTLRASTVPLAVAAVGFCYGLLRRCGLRPAMAGFGALLVGWSPLYLPVAGSFMTDAPGLCVTTAALYGLVRAADAASAPAAVTWATVAMLVGGVGGTGRQIVWVVPLFVGPYAALVRWRRTGGRSLPVVVAGLWVAVLAGAVWTVHWFNRQPLTIPEPSPLADLKLAAAKPVHYAGNVIGLGLTLAWMAAPAAWAAVRAAGQSWRRTVAVAVLLAGVAGVLVVRHRQTVRDVTARHGYVDRDDPGFLWPYAMAPWTPNTVDRQGVMGNAELGGGDRPTVMNGPVRVAIAAGVFAVVAAVLVAGVSAGWAGRRQLLGRGWAALSRPGRVAGPALAIFAAVYLALLLPRAARDMVFDRYVLPLLPITAVPLLLAAQRQGDRRPPAAAWAALGAYGLFAVALTRDVSALAAARETAAARLVATGVPRTAIHGGFEYDAVTQLAERGRINDPRIRPRWKYAHRQGQTPAVVATHAVQASPPDGVEMVPSSVGPVGYWSPLPPFRRFVYVNRYADPWWADPARAATRPAGKPQHGLPDAALPADYDAPDTPVPPGQVDDR